MDTPLKKAIDVIVHVASPEKIILFGSRARDNAPKPDSDYDLLVLKRDTKSSRSVAHEIYTGFEGIGAPVDVLVTNVDQFEISRKDPYLVYHEADQNGKVVYEKP